MYATVLQPPPPGGLTIKNVFQHFVFISYESVVNLTALSRYAADDATWVHTASSTFLHS